MSVSDRLVIEQALEHLDAEWPEAEARVLETLAQRGSAGRQEDPVARLVARVAQQRQGPDGRRLDAASRYLESLGPAFEGTNPLVPPAHAVVQVLSSSHGARLREMLAVRLAQQPQAAHWRSMVRLGYLDAHRSPGVTEAIIRFAARTRLSKQQAIAATVLRRLGDTALAAKLAAERQRLARTGISLPPALTALA